MRVGERSGSPPPGRRGAAARAVVGIAVGLVAVAAAAKDYLGTTPRPLAEAERAAVELAVLFLDQGPEAWWDRLAADSTLRALGREQALAEIEVRTGPAAEAEWLLQTPGPALGDHVAVFTIQFPSGLDETLALELVEADGEWRIVKVRSLVDPKPPKPGGLDGVHAGAGIREAGGRRWGGEARGASAPWAPAAPAALAAALALALWLSAAVRTGPPGARTRRRRTAAAVALAAAVAVGSAAALTACSKRSEEKEAAAAGPAAPKPAAEPPARLGALLPLRLARAAGTDPERIEALFDAAPTTGPAGDVANLWRAERRLWRFELREAEKLLLAFPKKSPIPLAELLRARLALFRGDAEGAEAAYDRAIGDGIDHDGLRLELAQSQALLASVDAAKPTFQLLADMGSRIAGVYYSLAELAALNEDGEGGEALFRTAWGLEPIEREEIFGDPALSNLAARPSLFPLFAFGEPDEPVVAPAVEGRRPIELPAGAMAVATGGLLRIAVGTAQLSVPGGSVLAPAETAVEDAGSDRRRREERALARVPALVEAAGSGILAHPRRRQQAADAALALARRNRWAELVALTDGVDDGGRLPPLLARLRAVALRQTDRAYEARLLLLKLAKRDLVDKRRDPGNLAQLGELFAVSGDYQLAIRLLRKAGSISPYGVDKARIRQLEMEQELATSYQVWWNSQFEIRYPSATGDKYPRQVAAVLREERKRLRRWIPVADDARIQVNLFPLNQFIAAYAGGLDVVGLYDGKVRVPFADLKSLHPELVEILTHELAHAMIGAATHDQAPHWFQEGLAQHVEMGTGPINPIPELARVGRILAFPMLDPILKGFSEPQLVGLAYSEAAWAVHFIEVRYGVKALHRLIDAFAEGLDTEDALTRVLNLTPAEFDRAAWAWCRSDAPPARTVAVRRYDLEYDSLVERSEVARAAPPARREAVRRTAPEAPPPQRSLAEWHRIYSARVKPFKRVLAKVLPELRSGRELPEAGCYELAEQVDNVLADPDALAPPDRRVAAALRTAYRWFAVLSEACQGGDLNRALYDLARAERELDRAAATLAPHGLQP